MSLVTNITDGFTALSTAVKAMRVMVTGSSSGTLASLQTTDKASIIAAINEARTTGGSGAPPNASETVVGVVELASLAEMAVGTDPLRVATVAGVRQERAALKTEILGAGVPAALDTLDELAAALADDANYAASITTALAGKQPSDLDLTAIAALPSAADKIPYATGAQTWALAAFTQAGRDLVGGADAAAQRTTLSVFSKAEIGDIAHDFAADVATGLA